ncbi:E3 ubiquitin-protein ligase KCMF1-like isoform X2 [Tubulanus polymorphus]|uniref:E3 ubiquitin-protein ligase KCMF1-like isoform X2 n=1 Tax=Tubulanus polymorphus TaxID=672921 RepID=UPI003DA3D5EE
MSRHEGVSCDSCMKSNFRGRRYKCLICYDYDLCSSCYEAGATTTRHSTDHAMQCILTRADFDVYYGGEALTSDQPQAFTCPYCGKMGYTEATLQEHVTSDHSDSSSEVVCPVCASLPGGDPNHVTDDFAAHLTLEHRTQRDFDEPTGIRHVRRIPHAGRGVGGMRTRRSNMHFSSASSALTGLSPSSRDSMDPIAELLSQLSSVRSRAAAAQSVSSQLQQLEMQLQSTRQQLERLPRQQVEAVRTNIANNGPVGGPIGGASGVATIDLPANNNNRSSSNSSNSNSQFLLARLSEPPLTEAEQQSFNTERADRSLFVQELLLSTLSEKLTFDSSDSDSSSDSLASSVNVAAGVLHDELNTTSDTTISSTTTTTGTTTDSTTDTTTLHEPVRDNTSSSSSRRNKLTNKHVGENSRKTLHEVWPH